MRIDTGHWSPEQKQLWNALPAQQQVEISNKGPEQALNWVQQQLTQHTAHVRGTVGAGKLTGRADKIRTPDAQASPLQGDNSLMQGLQLLLQQAHILPGHNTSAAPAAAPAQTNLQAPNAAMTPLSIGGSVGAGGQNRPEDVAQVQQTLHQLGFLSGPFTPGQIDASTTEAIRQYQQQNHLPVVDGRIDVSKSTMRHINQQIAQQGTPGRPTAPTIPNTPNMPAPTTPIAPGNNTPPAGPQGPTNPLPTPTINPATRAQGIDPANDARLQEIQQRAVTSAQQEWQAGVREHGGANRGDRIDEYARTARMSPGGEWCGYFTGFNHAQNGFQHTSSLASYQKARDFFMYRNYTKNTNDPANQQNDVLRTEHQARGDGRQYFMLQESPTIHRVTRNGSWGNQRYGHYDAAANTFNFQNLPVRGGDVALFNRGHVGLVESYNPQTGILTTIEGNASGEGPDGRRRSQAVVRKTYDLSDPQVRQQFDGFGRPALSDYQ